VLHRAVVPEIEVRNDTRAHTWLEMAANEPGRATQRRDGFLAFAIGAKNGDVDPRRAQIGEHFNAGDGPESEPRIVDLGADDVDDLLAEELAHLLRAPGHGRTPESWVVGRKS
jgi:hypothetical protein